ncbi:MAG: D-alanyl-D-alanine carboxypeptidase/D-alanyl-D-alanine-endopeptidase [Magnetococcales bacterium]|nr:D-alanyl-D-alanine carboxypeptidase/D-alanyl-D-alanine-endopeptidase [Magnetococcales bacterium]
MAVLILLCSWALTRPAQATTPNPGAWVRVHQPHSEKKRPSEGGEQKIIEASGVPKASIGFALYDLDNTKLISGHHAQRPTAPASAAKIPTTVAALTVLGSNHRFETTMAMTGHVNSQGVLEGNIHLTGDGDPFFHFGHLMGFADQLRKRGIRKISGGFYYDGTALPDKPFISSEFNRHKTFNPGIGALSIEFNRFHLAWRIGKKRRLIVRTTPPVDHFRVMIDSSGGRGRVRYRPAQSGPEGRESWRIQNRGKRSGSSWLPVQNANLYTARMLRYFAANREVELPAPQPAHTPAKAQIIHRHQGRTLVDLAEGALEYSNNLTAELISLATARRIAKGSRIDSLETAAEIIRQWFVKQHPKIDWRGFHLQNGSGLSRKTRITPRQMVEILAEADLLYFDGRTYATLLPIAAWKGTLLHRLPGATTSMKVWAKTGTTNDVRAMAGYLLSHQGRGLSFSIQISRPKGGGKGWKTRADRLVQRLTAYWVKRH